VVLDAGVPQRDRIWSVILLPSDRGQRGRRRGPALPDGQDDRL